MTPSPFTSAPAPATDQPAFASRAEGMYREKLPGLGMPSCSSEHMGGALVGRGAGRPGQPFTHTKFFSTQLSVEARDVPAHKRGSIKSVPGSEGRAGGLRPVGVHCLDKYLPLVMRQ
jgi:hypothetical protein